MSRLTFLAFVVLLAVVLIIISADLGKLPPFISSLYAFPYGDKVGHFLLMGTLSLLVNLCLSCKSIHFASRSILIGSLITAIVITVEELSQIFVQSRSFTLIDLVSSYLGIWAFGRMAVFLKKSQKSMKPVS